jgi:hypothetical protein
MGDCKYSNAFIFVKWNRKNEATTIDSVNNLQNSQVQYNNSNGIIRGRFSRALAASDTSNDVPIILGNSTNAQICMFSKIF